MENKLSELQTFLNLYNQLFNFPLTLYTFEKGFFFSTLELDDIAKDFLSYQQKYVEPLIDENECVNIFTEDFSDGVNENPGFKIVPLDWSR